MPVGGAGTLAPGAQHSDGSLWGGGGGLRDHRRHGGDEPLLIAGLEKIRAVRDAPSNGCYLQTVTV
jgi:hypothetical protein